MSDTTIIPIFEHIYNSDGTCHADHCGAPGLILAYDDFSPEIAQWFCGMHWQNCAGKEWLTVAEDRRNPLHTLLGWDYAVKETDTPGLFRHTWTMPLLTDGTITVSPDPSTHTQRWDWATVFGDVLGGTLPTTPISIDTIVPSRRLWRRYLRLCAQRAHDKRLHQRARARHRRQVRAAFRRRKRGLA